MDNAVFILWLGSIDPALLSDIPSLHDVIVHGADIQLMPQPLPEQRACYYQTLTGMGSGKTGYFDSVKPVAYHPQPDDDVPEGAIGRLLPELLRTRGLTASLVEAQTSADVDRALQQRHTCMIVRVPTASDAAALDDLIQRCRKNLSGDTHLLVLTDLWSHPAAKSVNVNNYLADIGLLDAGPSCSRESVIWSETLAYSLGTGQIWVNLRGREPQGSVAVGREYQQVCQAVQQELLAWRDPDSDEAIVARVLTKEEAYAGEYLFKAPDLIVEYRPGYRASPQAMLLDFDSAAIASGPSAAGIREGPSARLIAYGPEIVPGQREIARLIDIAPNVMYLLGQPAPSHVDGTVIPFLFTEAHRQRYPHERLTTDSPVLTYEEEEHVEERLRALGYLG